MPQIEFKYEPRPHFEAFHQRNTRWAAMVCHRRAGKTVACVGELLLRAAYTTKTKAKFAYVAPYYSQAKDVAWDYVKELGKGMIVKIRESELKVELINGATITLYGADNPDRLRGLYLDGVVLDEYGDCRPSLWGTVILPTLADRKGWAVFIGTPRGQNSFYEMVLRAQEEDNWFFKELKASTSGILDPDELKEMRAQMTTHAYEAEMECSFDAAVEGTFYSSMLTDMSGRGQILVDEPCYDPDQPVYVACDLGFTDSTAFWFWQAKPDGFAVIDHYEMDGVPLIHYLEMLVEKGYDYSTIYLPHDAKAKTLQTGKSTVEQVLDYFEDDDIVIDIVPRLSTQHGIDAARLVLPTCYINSSTCKAGLMALRNYRRAYDEVNKVFSDKPKHDWSSHSADAFRYMALACREPAKQIPAPEFKGLPPPEYTLDDLFADAESGKKPTRYAALRM